MNIKRMKEREANFKFLFVDLINFFFSNLKHVTLGIQGKKNQTFSWVCQFDLLGFLFGRQSTLRG